jgi:hypothetical protein
MVLQNFCRSAVLPKTIQCILKSSDKKSKIILSNSGISSIPGLSIKIYKKQDEED